MTGKKAFVSIVAAAFLFSGCAAHHHQVGSGAAGANAASQRQWYILFGLVPLNNVDTATMASGASNYEVDTEMSVLDVVLGVFTGIVTVNSRTVTVTQ